MRQPLPRAGRCKNCSVSEGVGQRIHADAIDLRVYICFRAVEQYFRLFAEHFIVSEVLQAAEDPRDTMLSAIALCVGEALAYVMIFLVSFIVLLVLIHWAASVFDIFTRLPVIHSCNALLGGALGLVCGLVLCTVVLWAVKLVAPAAYSDAGLLSPSVMENSAIAGKLVGWNDGVSLFESNPANT